MGEKRPPERQPLRVVSAKPDPLGNITLQLDAEGGPFLTWRKGDTERPPAVGDLVLVQLPVVLEILP
jgi:hypothetical protein